MWTLRAGLAAGTVFSGKGVCMAFWSQRLYLTQCAAVAVVLAAAIGARVWWGSHGGNATTRA
jgi:hypothetical protein